MNDTANNGPEQVTPSSNAGSQPEQNDAAEIARQRKAERKEARRWWIKLVIQPLLFLACGALLFRGLGVAQQLGWISGDGGGEKQKICPVADYLLGSMGPPHKVDVNGRSVFICCEGCRASLLEEPDKYLAKLAENSTSQEAQSDLPQTNLPPIGVPQVIEPQMNLPQIGVPKIIESQEELPRMEPPQAVIDRVTDSSSTTATNAVRGIELRRNIRAARQPVARPSQSGSRNQLDSKEVLR